MPVFQWFLLLLAAANFAAFIWAVFRFFRTKGKPGIGLWVIKILSPIAYAINLRALSLPGATDGIHGWIGAVGFTASFFLFFSTIRANRAEPLTLAYDSDVPEHLNRKGPYQWVRHPFYSSYLLAFASGWVASGDPRLVVIVVAFTLLYWDASTREEVKFARSPFASEYADYRSTTGRFLPRPQSFFRCFSNSRS